jgi:hypothetical protein
VGQVHRLIVAEDRPTYRAMNPTTWIKSTNYPKLEYGRWLANHEQTHVRQIERIVSG